MKFFDKLKNTFVKKKPEVKRETVKPKQSAKDLAT